MCSGSMLSFELNFAHNWLVRTVFRIPICKRMHHFRVTKSENLIRYYRRQWLVENDTKQQQFLWTVLFRTSDALVAQQILFRTEFRRHIHLMWRMCLLFAVMHLNCCLCEFRSCLIFVCVQILRQHGDFVALACYRFERLSCFACPICVPHSIPSQLYAFQWIYHLFARDEIHRVS